jgi:hypothetical protein
MCGFMELDGYAFCLGLKSLELSYEAYPGLQSLIRSVIYLIIEANFRPKHITSSLDRFCLDICPLGELIDMYHTYEATNRHDKIYTLLGISSDDPIAADLLPDYEIPWERLLERLIRFLFGGQVSVKTWAETEMAVIKSKGCILGQVSSEGDADRDGRLQVVITSKDTSGHLGPERKWTLQISAKPVQVDDLVCLLYGASKPTIIRLNKNYFSVIMIAVPLLQPEQLVISFPHDFLLVWD